MKAFFAILFLAFVSFSNITAASYINGCPIEDPNSVVAFCTGENNLGINFPARTSSQEVKAYPFGVGCLGSTPSPTWFIMQIEDEGDLILTMNHSEEQDIDFACWGPFQGKSKTEVLDKLCADPDKYFVSPDDNGNPYINVCEKKYYRYIDSIARKCFEEKTGLTVQNAYFYETEYFECEEYATSLVPAEIENDLNRSYIYSPYDEEVSDCFVTMEAGEITMVDCSYSGDYIETCTIRNAKHGDWYVLLITNYSMMPGNIFFNKTGGTATTNCKIIVDASSTGPYCEGDDIQFIINNMPENATFQWRGPNGFTSNEAEPSIPKATLQNAGSYFVKMHSGDETSDEVEVVVTVGKKYTTDTTIIIDPQHPFLFGEKEITQAGVYQHTFLSSEGCDSTVTLTATSTEIPRASSTGPYCEGDVIQFIVENKSANATFQWRGPNGFASTEAEPTISKATSKEKGSYFVTMQKDGKTSKEVEVIVSINRKDETDTTVVLQQGETFLFGGEELSEPGTYTHTFQNEEGCDSIVTLTLTDTKVTISNSGPYCEGETILLTIEEIAENTEIKWIGPDDFQSNEEAPQIENANRSKAGVYSLYIKRGDKEIPVANTHVEVKESIEEQIVEELVMGDTLRFGDLVIDKAGKYSQTFQTEEGCDSIVTLIVKTKLDEKTTIHPEEFFTPNGDGENDTWQIQNIELYPDATVYIYDRHGKLIRKFQPYEIGNEWDGTDLNERKMPSGDYWFVIDINSIDKMYVGHVTLLR
ncbi:MAG: T9SS type B sorting domain-containing protein [Paludibacteraceae bacterium]|nr:T9SS type B sorting domain-containing protein [Paludibacteraceae bacterium]